MRELKFRMVTQTTAKLLGYVDIYDLLRNGVDVLPEFEEAVLEGVEFEQYTGLRDKNGKEIYGGDIIRVQNGEHTMLPTEKKTDGSEVVFECGAFKYLSDNGIENTMEHLYPYNLEVIGNIHENWGLLK